MQAKKISNRFHLFGIEVYPVLFGVYIYQDAEEANRVFNIEVDDDDIANNLFLHKLSYGKKNYYSIAILIIKEGEDITYGELVHEVWHLASHTYEYIGQETKANDEHIGYFLSLICEKITNIFRKNNINIIYERKQSKP